MPASRRRSALTLAAVASIALGEPGRLVGDDVPTEAIARAAERLQPSVVGIAPAGRPDLRRVGVAVAEGGWIATTLLATWPDRVVVTTAGGEDLAGRIVADDRLLQVSLVHVENDPLPTPIPMKAEELRVGQTAIALGRAGTDGSPVLSVGIVSATDRLWGKAVQTDARVGANYYAGPLVSLDGRLVGVIVPLAPDGKPDNDLDWYESGIGFAIGADRLAASLDRVRKSLEGSDDRGEERITLEPGRAGVGLGGHPLLGEPTLASVAPGGPAADAGLREGDRIVSVGWGEPPRTRAVERNAELLSVLKGRYAGDRVVLTVEREGDTREATLELVATLPQPAAR